MSVTVLTYKELDRIFSENLRRAVVTAGYLPDVRLYSANPAGYEAAKAALRTSLGVNGRIIDVFSTGTWDSREEKDTAGFIIDRTGTAPGEIGGFPEVAFTQTSGSGASAVFSKSNYPSNSTNLQYTIRVVSDRTDVGRIMETIITTVFGTRKFMFTVDDAGTNTTNSVLVKFYGSADVSDERYYEKVFKFEICEVFVEPMVVVQTGIPAMTEVTTGVYIETPKDTPETDPVLHVFDDPA